MATFDVFKYANSRTISIPDDSLVVTVPRGIVDADQLLQMLNNKLNLPEYFGFNWNALEECLRDFHWLKQRTIVLIHDDLPALSGFDRLTYVEVLDNCIRHWRQNDEHQLIVTFPECCRNEIEKLADGVRIDANGSTNELRYDQSGNLTDFIDGEFHKTTWMYDMNGRVYEKLDHNTNVMFIYSFDANDRLTNRWTPERNVNTRYDYDNVGNLTSVRYPTATNAFEYDSHNRMISMSDSLGTTVFTYTPAGLLDSEDGPWANDLVTFSYTDRLRRGITLLQPSAASWTLTYAYDSIRRLTNITSGAGSFRYAYVPQRQTLISKLALPNGAYITNSYDEVTRLLTNALANSSGTVLSSFSYGYNTGNQRTNVVRSGLSYVSYTYDSIGQLKTSTAFESNNTARLHEKFGYNYDAAGNLKKRTNNALVQSFDVNALNELTSIVGTGTLTVAGTTTSSATNVAVNTVMATLYTDSTFARDGIVVANGSNTFTAVAADSYGRKATNVVTVNISTNLMLQYDDNGNLTNDSQRSYTYDDENRLTSVWATNAWRTDFVYDGKMRCRVVKEYGWNNGWMKTNELRYIYDGMLVLQERDENNICLVSYTRGSDLSGSFDGAGGIGGLLARTDCNCAKSAFYHTDGNGNVTTLVNDEQGIDARYIYDPAGNVQAKSGRLADLNKYQFSTKEFHSKSGVYYYGYRFYSPQLQRWLNRDPLGERGPDGPNMYAFVRNSFANRIDGDGRVSWGPPFFPPPQPTSEGPLDCGNRIKNEVWKKYGVNRPPNDPSARKAHCIAHCRISRECPGGDATSWLGGFGKEVQDQFKKWGGGGGDGFDPGDMAANALGRKCGKKKDKTCEELCDDAFNNGSLYPPPPDLPPGGDWGNYDPNTGIAYPL